MKFHLKLTLAMLALLALLFGLGGSLLVAASFDDALEREKSAAFDSYRLAWGTLQVVNDLESYLNRDILAQTMEQLYQRSSSFWESCRLATPDELIYETGPSGAAMRQPNDGELPTAGQCLMSVEQADDGRRLLVLSGAIEADESVLYLTACRDIDGIYAAKSALCRTYSLTFLLLISACAVLSYGVSRTLTAPPKSLSRATRAIASGRYASRVPVRSSDEIGALSEDFNAMALQLDAHAKQRERYIEQLRQYAERQEQFVGSFAHEMKTPMTSLIGYADLLRSGKLTPEEQLEAVGYLHSEGKRLERLSRKLLELLVVRQQEVALVPGSPKALVSQLAGQLRPVYGKEGIRVSFRGERGTCLMEPDLLWSLLLNLADNARKAMEGGGELRFEQAMTAEGCVIRVLDTGRGIPSQVMSRLTEAFYRVDKSRSRKQGGFGLGLALCQEIAELHRGSLRFENREEGGLCVTVELRGGRP